MSGYRITAQCEGLPSFDLELDCENAEMVKALAESIQARYIDSIFIIGKCPSNLCVRVEYLEGHNTPRTAYNLEARTT